MSAPAVDQGAITAREFLCANIHAISETLLSHDAGVDQRNGRYLCPCGMQGTEQEWEQHVANKAADEIGGGTVQQALL